MKKSIICCLLLILGLKVYSNACNDTQLLQAGHWIYNDLYALCSEVKKSPFIDVQPMSIGEIKFYFSEIDYDTLSVSGKLLYTKINDFLNKDDNFIKQPDVRLYVNPKVNTELFYKTNPDIPFSFNYAMNDRFITFPIIFGLSNYFTIQTDPFIGKNHAASQKASSFTNIPYAFEQMEVLMPRFAYGSAGITGENWGVNFNVGKEGLTIGNTLLGSIIYNKTFETDFYAQLNIFTRFIKYNLDVIQVQSSKYIYFHQINFRPFDNFKFGAIEGTLLNAPFELRFMNPLFINHSFIGWKDYSLTSLERRYYAEGHFGAYLCFNAEYIPTPNLRIYAYYSQNEIMDPGWEHHEWDYAYPDSLGGQLGVEYLLPFDSGSRLKNTLEVSYTSPFLYVKQSPDWSFLRARTEEISGEKVYSWMGSPFGPDCFAVMYQAEFQSVKNFTVSAGYMFKIKGENGTSLFVKSTRQNEYGEDESVYLYYPYAQYMDATTDAGRKAAVKRSRNMWMSGIKEYTNQFNITGQYMIKENMKVFFQTVFTFIFNNKNIQDNFDSGFEFGIGFEYKLF